MNPAITPGPWEKRVKSLLSPPTFFLGLILGFLTCCFGGRIAVAMATFRDFQRLHMYLSPTTLYFPTALQIRTLAERQLPPDKIAVIIGGSSVMEGVGQTEAELWTRRLQEMLGDEFRVLNLAQPGGRPTEHGQIAAEMLLPTHPRLIYVCDSHVSEFARYPDGNRDIYRYLFHDARAHGLLLDFPERDAALAELTPERLAKKGFGELQLRTTINRWLSFDDLWHVIGYEGRFTVWQPLSRKAPWRARKQFSDPPHNLDTNPRSVQERYLPVVREAGRPWKGAWPTDLDKTVLVGVPPALRPRTLAVVNRFHPDLVSQLDKADPGFRERYETNIRTAVDHLRLCGLEAVDGCRTLVGPDYVDGNHLAATGGAKLAAELAPVIREQARRLGYLVDLSSADP